MNGGGELEWGGVLRWTMEQTKCLAIVGENSALGTNGWPLWTLHFLLLVLSFSACEKSRESSSSDTSPQALPSPLESLSLEF